MNSEKLLICLLLLLLLQTHANAENPEKVIPDEATRLESDYRSAKDAFDLDTRAELTRIERDKSLVGEAKILAIQNWFSTRATQIETVNRAAEQLDRLYPVTRQQPPVLPVADDTPGTLKALRMQAISRRYAKGEIDLEEFDRLRAPLMAGIPAHKAYRKLLPIQKPPVPENLDARTSVAELAPLLTSQARYLASLSAELALAELSNPESPVNRLRSLLQTKKQMQQP